MKKILASLMSLFYFNLSQATVIVSDSVVLTLNKQQIDSLYTVNGVPSSILEIVYSVDLHRVVYNTVDAQDNPTIASGLVIVPVGDTCPAPLVSYQHGTQSLKQEVFSNLKGEWLVGVAAATTGYVAAMPDYLGMGVSPGLHPYQHAKTQATCVIDILRAAKEIALAKDINLSGELFLLGYSQGGHATMATQQRIQELHSNEFTVTATAPLSGAYSMSGAQFDFVASFDPYAVPGYLPYLILGYQEAYGNLFNSYSEIFASPYDTLLPPLFDGTKSIGDINAVMPSVPRFIINPTYADAFFADSMHPFRVALRENDTYRFKPDAPIRMGYCTLDEEVNFLNAFVARDSMQARGATNVEIRQYGELEHFACAQPSILFSKFWFDSLSVSRNCNSTGIFSPKYENKQIKVFPNPASESTYISFTNKENESLNVYVMNTNGAILASQNNVTTEGLLLNLKEVPKGIYIVYVKGKKTNYWGKLVKQ